jgi:uncharacterized protein YndB with AHSA1/START domain
MSSNREIVTDAFRSWANGTGYVASIFADDMTWEITGRSAVSGKYARTHHHRGHHLPQYLRLVPGPPRWQGHRRNGLLRQHRVQRTLGKRHTLTRANGRRERSGRPGRDRKERYVTGDAHGSARILGRLGSEGGTGVVRMEDRFDAGIEDVWSALTDPSRLSRWYGEVEGDLRPAGEYRARVFATGSDISGRVEACEPPARLRVTVRETDESWREGQGAPPFDERTEVTLTADGDQTVLVIEVRGMPAGLLFAYGTGWQIHVEDLGAHLAGRGRGDAAARWPELQPAYEALAANIG